MYKLFPSKNRLSNTLLALITFCVCKFSITNSFFFKAIFFPLHHPTNSNLHFYPSLISLVTKNPVCLTGLIHFQSATTNQSCYTSASNLIHFLPAAIKSIDA